MAATPWRAYAALAASMALTGSYVGLSKLLLAVFPIFLLAWLRFGIAALAMPHWLKRQPGEAPLSSHDRRLLFWESFLGNFLFSICMLTGVALTSALAAGVVMAGIPAAVALLSRLFLGERIAPLPQDLGAALDALVADEVVSGALGPLLSGQFVLLKRQEFTAHARHVSDWELQRYAAAF